MLVLDVNDDSLDKVVDGRVVGTLVEGTKNRIIFSVDEGVKDGTLGETVGGLIGVQVGLLDGILLETLYGIFD